MLLTSFSTSDGKSPDAPVLTDKQRDTLHAVTRGLANEDIALQRGISPNSVKKQLESIFAKLGAASRAEAAAIAIRKNLLNT